jgi:hypothetical protein
MALSLWSMWQQQPKIMVLQNVNIDCCFSHCPANLHYEFWKVRETEKSVHKILNAAWIILLKEQFSFRITGFLHFIHCSKFKILENTFQKLDLFLSSGEGVGDTYYVRFLKKSRSQSLDKVQKLCNSECYIPSWESLRFYQQFLYLPPKPLISLCQLFKL